MDGAYFRRGLTTPGYRSVRFIMQRNCPRIPREGYRDSRSGKRRRAGLDILARPPGFSRMLHLLRCGARLPSRLINAYALLFRGERRAPLFQIGAISISRGPFASNPSSAMMESLPPSRLAPRSRKTRGTLLAAITRGQNKRLTRARRSKRAEKRFADTRYRGPRLLERNRIRRGWKRPVIVSRGINRRFVLVGKYYASFIPSTYLTESLNGFLESEQH